MMIVTPTLNFRGACREAIHTYAQAFHGRIRCLITYREANDPTYAALQAEQLDWVYHAELYIGEQRINMCDNLDVEIGTCHSTFLTLLCASDDEVRAAYAVLAAGSTTIYPMEATAYSSCRVVLIDRFNVRWGILKER